MAKLAAVRSSGLEIRKAATVLEIALVIASAFAATYTVSLDRRGYVRTRIAHGCVVRVDRPRIGAGFGVTAGA